MEITKEVRAAMIAKRTARKNEGIAEAERLKLDTESKRTERIRLHLRGWPDLNRDASRVKRSPSSFDWHKPCCVVHRASGARWLYPEGLGFDQFACAWGNDYVVVYANMLGIRIQFNENGERWPERRTDYFVVNYINA